MKGKKNLNKDLNLKRGLFFVIGLLLLLTLIYIALEWKTTHDNDGYDIGYNTKETFLNLLYSQPDTI